MGPLPAEKLLKALVKVGFRPVRQRGSHVILKHDDGRVIVVPVHGGGDIGRAPQAWVIIGASGTPGHIENMPYLV